MTPLQISPQKMRFVSPAPVAQALGALVAIIVSAILLFSTSLGMVLGATGIGAGQMFDLSEGRTQVRGYLATRQDYHFLGLQVTERFTTVDLLLSVEPLGVNFSDRAHTQSDPQLSPADTVNFLVLTELGLQRFLGGADPWEVNLAAGTLSPAADGTVRFAASFRGVERGGYTVLVYNNSDIPATYRLTVEGGRLIDGAGQTLPISTFRPLGGGIPGQGWLNPVLPRRVEPATTLTHLPIAALGRPAAVPTRAEAVGGQLAAPTARAANNPAEAAAPHHDPAAQNNTMPHHDPAAQNATAPHHDPAAQNATAPHHDPAARHYYVLEPTAADGEMTLSLAYETRNLTGAPEARQGGINFWVFTTAGLRQLDQGAPADFLSLASGTAFQGVPNLLRTQVRLPGQTAYVVVVYNTMGQAVDYRLRVNGGALVDLYAQSHAAQQQSVAAANSHQPDLPVAPEPQTTRPQTGPQTGLDTSDLLPPEIAAQLERYWVTPAPDANAISEAKSEEKAEKGTQSDSGQTLNESENAQAETPAEIPLEIPEPAPGTMLPAPPADDAAAKETAEETADETAEDGDEDKDEHDAAPALPRYRLPLFRAQTFEAFPSLVRSRIDYTTTATLAVTVQPGARMQWTVLPDSAFARAVVTLEKSAGHGTPLSGTPLSGTALSGTPHTGTPLANVEMWIVSAEGMRKVTAGVNPDQVTVTGFTALRLGQEQGVLQASFDALGYAPYTLLVQNHGDAPVTLDMTVRNGLFRLEPAPGNATPAIQ